MNINPIGVLGTVGTISIIETILRIFAYISFICVSFKGAQALNIYINKNSK